MLYLAQVHKKKFLDNYQLRLLARQESQNLWVVIPEETLIFLGEETSITENLLVLVQLSPQGDIESLEDARDWVINLVQTYLSIGMTPKQLEQEAERAENWRQSLTLQNQELARRTLELEARREQIQSLEERLQRDHNHHHRDSS
jgi:polyhydroxyalkanoate synthesis regulator phasin